MRSLRVFYDKVITAWLSSNAGQVVAQFPVAELFGQTFIWRATKSTALNAFNECGIFFYYAKIFTDADIVAAEATDIALNAEKHRSAEEEQSATPWEQNSLQLLLP